MNIRKILIFLAHAFAGWALCVATMGFSMAFFPSSMALMIHAIAAPIFFAVVSWVYFRRFHYTSPFQTALLFLAFVIGMDFFVVALLILHSLDMFSSLLGTWIPFALIFLSTWLTGALATQTPRSKTTI